jgi:dipeptidyl aminopeptidase/acylaminoacyl peptidase
LRVAWLAAVTAACTPASVELHRSPSAPRALPAYVLGALHVSGAPGLDRAIEAQLDRYGAIHTSRLLDISDDGTQLLVDQGGDAMLVARPLAAPMPKTRGVEVQWAAFGQAGAIEYAGDHDGSEDDRLYEVSGTTVKALVANHRIAAPIERHGRLAWAQPDADATAIWLRVQGAPKQVFISEGSWTVLDLSSDGRQLLAKKTVSLQSSTLYRIDANEGHAIALTSVDPHVAAPDAQFGAGGEVYAIASAGDRLNVWRLGARDQRLIAPELAWEVTQLAVSPDGGVVAFTTNEDGASVLYLYDAATHTHRIAPHAPTDGVISDLRFAAGARVLAFSFSDADHPRDVFTYDLASEATTAWTHADLGALPLATPERVQIGDVPVLVMRPTFEQARAPVIVELHGGPEDQWRPTWAPFEQFLVARGFAIIQPNVRGSVGYGQGYAAADDAEHRDVAVQDVGSVIAWAAAQPGFDPDRISVMGTSYGGYLALASLIAFPERLHAGIDIVGIADLVAFLEGTARYRQAARRTEYGDERDPAMRAVLAKLSPLTRAGAIKVPILVAHGRRDPRVPAAVSDELVAKVRAGGGTVWYLAADDEGHGFTKPDNLVALQTLIVQLLSL